MKYFILIVAVLMTGDCYAKSSKPKVKKVECVMRSHYHKGNITYGRIPVGECSRLKKLLKR